MTHELKTWDEYMHHIAVGRKRFEVRKNDREFKVGDTLKLKGYYPIQQKFTGEEIEVLVQHILHGGQFGLEEGYCIMSIDVINSNF